MVGSSGLQSAGPARRRGAAPGRAERTRKPAAAPPRRSTVQPAARPRERSRQGGAARTADRARARGRPRTNCRHGSRRDGWSARTWTGAAAAPAPTGSRRCVAARREVDVVELTSDAQDDHTAAKRSMGGAGVPARRRGDVTEMLALREAGRAPREGDTKPTVNDVLVKLAAVALVRHTRSMRSSPGKRSSASPSANVGIAVAAPQGLVVPVIRDADRRTIQEIAPARADSSAGPRRQARPADLEGARSRSRTSACSASSSSSPSSTRRRSRSSRSARPRRRRSSWTASSGSAAADGSRSPATTARSTAPKAPRSCRRWWR